mgnify:CR=1 FL=1
MIKILHLASFNGNIGDNASHKGLEYILNKFLKSCLFKIFRNASLCGISIGAFLSLGSTDGLLANHPNPFSTSASTQLKSSLPTDFDGDGYMDILDADSSGNLYLIRNSGLSYDKELLLSGYAVEDFAYLDLDQDGDQDFVLLNKEYGSLQVLKNLGSENFLPQNMVQLGSVKHAYLSDLDGDGDSDFAYSTPNMVGWAKNNGSEGFVPQASLDSGLVDVSALDVEDYNGDGKNVIHQDKEFDVAICCTVIEQLKYEKHEFLREMGRVARYSIIQEPLYTQQNIRGKIHFKRNDYVELHVKDIEKIGKIIYFKHNDLNDPTYALSTVVVENY